MAAAVIIFINREKEQQQEGMWDSVVPQNWEDWDQILSYVSTGRKNTKKSE